MSDVQQWTAQRVGRFGGRSFLVLATVAASICGLLGLMFMAMVMEWKFSSSFAFPASVATPLERVPLVQGTSGNSAVTYSTVQIESTDALIGPRMASAISEGLYFLLFIAGCIAVILICRRLFKDRPFTRVAHWALLGLGTLAIITSIASPWLAANSHHLAATELGFPTSGFEVANPDTDEWISTDGGFDIQDVNHSLFGLGAVLGLTSLAFRQGRRLQQDNDGLV